jgi:hypothetical protein
MENTMSRSVEAQQELIDEAYVAIRKLREAHDVDLSTLWEYIKDAIELAREEEAQC